MPMLHSTPITKEYEAEFNKSMSYISNNDYKSALPILTALKQTNNVNTNSNLEFYIGLCNFYLQFDKSIALESFVKASSNIAKSYKNVPEAVQAPNEAVYFQGLCFHYLAQTDNAVKKYEEYILNSKKYGSDRLLVADAKRKLKIAKENPILYSQEEHQKIKAYTPATQKNEKEFKAKLTKVMETVQDDKIVAFLEIKELLKTYPTEPNLNYLMGICLLNMKPYNDFATDYFVIADKNASSFKASGAGLDCPSFVKYYSGVANQAKGDHKQALADFEAFNAVYPEEYAAFKPEFIQRMEYSRNMLKNSNTTASTDVALIEKRNRLTIIDTAGLKVLFPILGTPIAVESNGNNTNNGTKISNKTSTNDSEIYYSVQVGAGNMDEKYFTKVTDLRTSIYQNGLKRYLTGKYSSKEEALTRLNELISLGYKDAFVTRMKKR